MTGFFKNKAVRDLAWMIQSPPLMEGEDFVSDQWLNEQYNKHLPWLKNLDQHPGLLTAYIRKKEKYLLGTYFERLVRFWLENSSFFRLVTLNEQVFEEDITSGEVDFLFEEVKTGKYFHLETAVKFYLGYQNNNQWFNWIGPKANDRLDLKLNRLLQKQLKIFDSPAGKMVLDKYDIDKVRSAAFVKGYFFYHKSHFMSPPLASFPLHQRGWWLYSNEVKDYLNEAMYWALPNRLDWLSPLIFHKNTGLYDKGQVNEHIQKHFSAGERPVLLCGLKKKNNYWEEISRGFVVAPGWPKNKKSTS